MSAEVEILVVDDDPDILSGTALLLRTAGYGVLEAANGEKGLEIVQERRPALVLLDRVLPDIQGLEVCRRIKADPGLAGIFVILLSNYHTSSREQSMGLESGADGCIGRPISNRELVARVEAMLRIRRTELALRQSEERCRFQATALHESESLLRSVLENIPDCVVRYDRLGRHLYANSRAVLQLGQACIGKTHRDLGFPAEQWPLIEATIAGVFHTRELHVQVIPWDGPAGPRFLEWRVIPEVEVDGSLNTALGLFRDITERLQAEEALRRSQEVAQVGHWSWDPRTDRVSWSEQMTRIWGWDPADFGGDRTAAMRRAIHPDDLARACAHVEHARGAGGVGDIEFRVIRPDGAVRYVWLVAGDRNTDEQDRPLRITGVAQDITERKLLEQQLKENNRSLEERVEQGIAELRARDRMLIVQSRHAAMGEMLGNIAHQWRQPLNTLGLVLANLQDVSRLGELDGPTVDEAVNTCNRLIHKMSSTIRDFTGFFKPAKHSRLFSALGQAREAVALVEASYRNSGVTIEIEALSDVSLRGLPNEYSQVILNLLSNAKQSIVAHRVQQGRVRLRLEESEGFVRLTVSDNGGGIRADVMDKLFDPYFTTRRGGTGIGLYMSRQIIESSFGGRVEARNAETGAEFSVLVPRAAPSSLEQHGSRINIRPPS